MKRTSTSRRRESERTVGVDDLFNVKGLRTSLALHGPLPVSEWFSCSPLRRCWNTSRCLVEPHVGCPGRRCPAVKVPTALTVEPPIEFVSRRIDVPRLAAMCSEANVESRRTQLTELTHLLSRSTWAMPDQKRGHILRKNRSRQMLLEVKNQICRGRTDCAAVSAAA